MLNVAENREKLVAISPKFSQDLSLHRIWTERKLNMPIQLHSACKDRLIEKLAEVLPGLRVCQPGQYLSFFSFGAFRRLDSALPSAVLTQLKEYISDDPIFDFLYNEIFRRLRAAPESNHINLSEILPNLSNELVSALELLPNSYSLIFVLPPIHLGEWPVRISDSFVIEPLSQELGSALSVSVYEGNNILGSLDSNVQPQRKVMLRYDFEGYVPTLGLNDSISIRNAIAEVKAFFGAAFALELFSSGEKRNVENSAVAAGYVLDDGHLNLLGLQTLNAFESSRILNLRLERTIDAENPSPGLIGMLSPPPFDRATFESWLSGKLAYIKLLFSSEPALARIRRACHWYFDSLCSSTELLSYIQAITVLEILLGDEKPNEDISLTALLKNRCAYLVSDSVTEREATSDIFTRIYKTRCAIVHRGKNFLSSSEKEDLRLLQKLCRKVIFKELSLFISNPSPSAFAFVNAAT